MNVLILGNSFEMPDSNQIGFGNAFLERGDNLYIGLIDTISANDYVPFADCRLIKKPITVDNSVDGTTSRLSLESFDLVWVLNNPSPAIARDVWLHLLIAEQRVQFVNSVISLAMLNTKSSLGLFVPKVALVENIVDYDFDRLWGRIKSDGERQWILKPTIGGCGSDVFLIDKRRVNARALIQSVTGNQSAAADMAIIDNPKKYVVLQGYIENASRLDKRVVAAGGKVITQFGRRAAGDDHRCNKTAGGELIQATLDNAERELCQEVSKNLRSFGINFAGIDLCYPYVIEINMVTPGGVGYARDNGSDVTFETTLEEILSSLKRSGRRCLQVVEMNEE